MKYLILFISIFLSFSVAAQSASEAESLFNRKEYKKALSVYEQVIKKRPKDVLLNYRAGRCAYEVKDYFAAAAYFEKAGTKYPLTPFYLGDSYCQSFQFEKALAPLQQYVGSKDADPQKVSQCTELIRQAEIGSRMITRVEDISVTDSTVVNKADFLQFYRLQSDLGTIKRQPLKLPNKGIADKITYTTQRGDRTIYSDTIKGGKMELFSSYKLLDEWSAPTLLSKTLSTPANENYPYLMSDGLTLYFASDNENSLGGYDIFMTRYSSSTKDFLVPENVGFPFNSTANDYMLVLDELQKTGWFATDRNQPAGKVVVYAFLWSENKKYIKTTDSVELYNRARLLKYTKVKKAATTRKTTTAPEEINSSLTSERITINDSVVYSSADDFKLEQARDLFNESKKLSDELKSLQNNITDYRNSFEDAPQQERQALATKIGETETKIFQLKKEIAQKRKQAINEENNFLSGKSN